MKLAIVGSRTYNDWTTFQDVVDALVNTRDVTSFISGGAKGTDSLAELYAKIDLIPIEVKLPEWSLGKHAGFIRNKAIVDECDIALVFWDGQSTGTLDTINKLASAKKPFTIYYYESDEFESFNWARIT